MSSCATSTSSQSVSLHGEVDSIKISLELLFTLQHLWNVVVFAFQLREKLVCAFNENFSDSARLIFQSSHIQKTLQFWYLFRGGHRHLQIGRINDIDLILEPPPHAQSPQIYVSKMWESVWPEGQEAIHS
jgi:hypothetical protein